MRRIVSATLEGFGYETRPAGHGQEALDVLQEGWTPDLCTTDWNMPVMDGLQFVSVVRANPAWPPARVAVGTGAQRAERSGRGAAAGRLRRPGQPGLARPHAGDGDVGERAGSDRRALAAG